MSHHRHRVVWDPSPAELQTAAYWWTYIRMLRYRDQTHELIWKYKVTKK